MVLICDSDLDAPSLPPVVEVAGTFTGESLWKSVATPGMPFVELGLGDFSLEWILRGRETASAFGVETLLFSGIHVADEGGEIANGLNIGDISVGNSSYSMVTGVGVGMGGTYPGPTQWSHMCLSVDRAGLASTYVNGVLDASRDATPGIGFDLPPRPVWPMGAQSTTRSFYDSLTEDHDLVDSPMIYLGGFAVHARQLSPAEIVLNAANLRPGNYPETYVRYVFATFVDGVGAPVVPTQETVKANIALGAKWGLEASVDSALYVPVATPGTLFIEDTSGNGLHWPLATQAAYDSADLADRGICGFAAVAP